MADSDPDTQQFSDDLRKRQQFRGAPRRIKDVVNDLLARRGYARVQATSELDAVWRGVVGKKLADETRVGNVRRGVLEIMVRNSAVVQELTFQKRQLLKSLLAGHPESKVRDLRFRVGGVD